MGRRSSSRYIANESSASRGIGARQRCKLRLFVLLALALISHGGKTKTRSDSFVLHVVGYYNNSANICAGLVSAVARNISLVTYWDLSTFQIYGKRVDQAVQNIAALTERLVHAHAVDLKRAKIGPRDVILVVDLERTSFLGNLQTIRKLTRRLYYGLRKGKIYYFEASHKPGSHFLVMMKSIEKLNTKYEILQKGGIFCSADEYHDERCRFSPVAVHEGSATLNKIHEDVSITLDLTRLHGIPSNFCNGSSSDELYSKWSEQAGHFWLNLADALERSTLMKAQISLFKHKLMSTRVDAFSAADLARLTSTGELLIPREQEIELFTRRSQIFRELACTLTHVKAIAQAYISGREIALITEDDVKFPSHLMEQISKLLRDAPDDWESIQLITVNENINYKLSQLYATQFVKWYPSHWSTAAYFITRSGMRKTLEKWTTMRLDGVNGWQDDFKWIIPEGIPYLADEAIYYLTQSYTHTRFIVELSSLSLVSSVQSNGVGLRQILPPARPSIQIFAPVSLILISTVRVSFEQDVMTYYNLLLRNFDTLSTNVKYSEMLVYFVCIDKNLVKTVKRMLDAMLQSPSISAKVTHDAHRFNKFYFVSQAIPKLAHFERVVLMDSDMDLSGFPVLEFFELAHKYTIAGAVHGNIEESLSENTERETRQWFKIFDSKWWQTHDPKALFVDMVFVEQGFVYFDGKFAGWFFSKILTDRHVMYHSPSGELLPRESDFGPDLLWCGAAQDWLSRTYLTDRTRACGVTTYPIQHKDTRQIGRQAIDESDELSRKFKQRIERRPLEIYAAHFPAWFKFSRKFVASIGGKDRLSSKIRRKYLRNTASCIARTNGC